MKNFFYSPKIAAKIECPGKEDLYLIGTELTLTHQEAIHWVNSHRLDAVIVHHPNGNMHLRSRPRYHMQTLKLTWEQHCETAGEIDTLARVKNAVLFLRHLLALSEQQNNSPVIVFAHSQGAAIVEHALVSLSKDERRKIRIFTFGGWSFVAPDTAHPESHNYASIGDLIPRMGSFNLQYLAIRRYEGFKEGLSLEEIISRLAFGDAIKDLDNFDARK